MRSLCPGLLAGRLNHGNGGVAARGNFFDVGGVVADVNQAEAAQECIAFGDDQNIIAAGEKCDAPSRSRPRRIAEKFRGNLKAEEAAAAWVRRMAPAVQRLAGRAPARPAEAAADENIAVRAGDIAACEVFQAIQCAAGLPNVQGHESRGSRRTLPELPDAALACCNRSVTTRSTTPRPTSR